MKIKSDRHKILYVDTINSEQLTIIGIFIVLSTTDLWYVCVQPRKQR